MTKATPLARYDAACRALAEAKRVDEVKEIRDQAIAMQEYARRANNHELEANAFAIRMEATRRLGKMIEVQKNTVGLASGREGKRRSLGLPENPSDRSTLASQGIDKNLANNARKYAALSDEDFERVVSEGRDAIKNVGEHALRANTKAARRAERTARLVEASRTNAPLLSHRRYPIILADPPWSFHVYNGPDKERTAERHYPAMSTEKICALPVDEVATPDAVLFLWAVACDLPGALRVVTAWGFEYVTHLVWVKDKAGLGHWVRNQHELLLIARRGDMPTPLPKNRPPSVIQVAKREHSRKPDQAFALIERMFPDLPKIELFARTPRPGWDRWGNETERFAADDSAA
jgi:N6-adenosine-specific RNA methylase IME4